MTELYIDAENAITGRLGAYIAKRALLGDTVKVMNCEKAVIAGSKEKTIEKYHTRKKYMGKHNKGPYYPRMPGRFFKRVIRGMLPYKRQKGSEAFKRITCYTGIPVKFKDQKLIKIKQADASKLTTLKKVYIQEICKALSGK